MTRCALVYLRGWIFAAAIYASGQSMHADPVAVRYHEGTIHGFLVLRTHEGNAIASGDLVQTIRGDVITSRLTFRFKDGSLDDETAVFSQRGHFQLIRDHRIQKGPSFPHAIEMSIDVPRREVTVRSGEAGGKGGSTIQQMDLPADLANGMVLSLLKNMPPEVGETKVSMIVATPKPRLIKLAISPAGEEPFLVAGSRRKATHFVLKLELGGVQGVIAPLVGKQPPNVDVWILRGSAPAFVKEEGPFYLGSPIWRIELTSPVWPNAARSAAP